MSKPTQLALEPSISTNFSESNMTTLTKSATRFLSAGGFHYAVGCVPIAALDDHFNLSFTTQWDDARNPDDTQVAMNVTLKREELSSLVGVLQRALASAS